MKVILLDNVAKLGKKYEVKNVSDGFARNFLFPRKLAEIATSKNISSLDMQKSLHEEKVKIEQDALQGEINKIKDVKLVVKGKTSEKGHLFAGIHVEKISELFKEQASITIAPDYIILDSPLKEVGEHKIDIKVGDKKTTCTLTIESE